MAAPTLSTDAIRVLQDRSDITDVLYRYASTIDRFDHAGLRSVLADDLWAQYGNADPVVGGDAVAAWIGEAIAPVVWQHHELRREEDGWKISRLVLEILWGEDKADAAGYLALIGGRGPEDVPRG